MSLEINKIISNNIKNKFNGGKLINIDDIVIDETQKYIVRIIYNKHWYAVLPTISSNLLEFLYDHCIKRNMHFSFVRQYLLENNIENTISGFKTKDPFNEIRKSYYKSHNIKFPQCLDDFINIFILFGLIDIEKDRLLFNENAKCAENILIDLPNEIIDDIAGFDTMKQYIQEYFDFCDGEERKIRKLDNFNLFVKDKLTANETNILKQIMAGILEINLE